MFSKYWIGFFAVSALSLGVAFDSDAGTFKERLKAKAETKRARAEKSEITPFTVSYGDKSLQNMDIYVPKTQFVGPRPVIVMVHGGGWRMGDKQMGAGINNKQAYWGAKGYIVISVNYRLLPEADVWTQVQDVAAAIRYVQGHIFQYGGDASHMIVMGHSAGAHLIGLISVNPQRFEVQPWRGSVVLDTATMDVPATMTQKHMKLYDDAFGTNRQFWLKTSPIDNMAKEAMPMFLVCSTKRLDKPCDGVEDFAQKARAMGIIAHTLHQPLSHADINQTLGLDNDMTKAVDAFIKAQLED